MSISEVASARRGGCQSSTNPVDWHHAASQSTLVVYVDDMLLIADIAHEAALWAGIEKHVIVSEPALPIDRYLGAHYIIEKYKDTSGVACVYFSVEMYEFLASACRVYSADILKIPGALSLKMQKADTPYTLKDTAGDTDEPAGVMSSVCASH